MSDSILARLEAVEAELEIRNLVARYAFAMDDRDTDAIREVFTKNARVWSGDGAKDSRGREALVTMYDGRFARLGATNHIVHQMLIKIESSTRATGLIAAHAEVWRNGRQQSAGLRYEDVYEKEEGRWRIADRRMLYFYYVPVEQYGTILGRVQRNLTNDHPIDADVPEKTASFKSWMQRHSK
jgi:uncharacterized protein (TIGR02246 family)